MLGHVLKEMAGYEATSGDFKTILLDNAEGVREDFQQALRRVMEKHYEATQFVIATRQPSTLIPAIQSRCLPIPVRSPTNDEVVSVLEDVVQAEGVEYDDDGLSYVAGHADGDLRTPWAELYYRNLVRLYADEILDGAPEECTFYDGAKSQEIVDALTQAHFERRWVDLPLYPDEARES
jgi:DNA polymerase III delta prime subunit